MKQALVSVFLTCLCSAVATAGERNGVVVSIKPIHSLVAAVMSDVGTPHLIVKGSASPHTYALKPSDAEALEHAKTVFWVGPDLEAFLERSIDTLALNAQVVALENAHGLKKLSFREDGPFEAHEAEGDDHHDKHTEKHSDQEKETGHGHEEAKHGHEEAKHAHGMTDPHFWLDPENAKVVVHEIEEALSRSDPGNSPKYKANAAALERRLDALSDEIAKTLAPVRERPFIVFHDGYQYFEKRFGLHAAGSITVNPERPPGARRISEINSKIGRLGATCVFSEPQFQPRLVKTVTEGTSAKTGVLDPVGATLPDGPELYFTLLRNMANSMKACLSPSS